MAKPPARPRAAPAGPAWLRQSNNAVGLFRRALDGAVRGACAEDVADLIAARPSVARLPWAVRAAIRPITDYFQAAALRRSPWTVSGELKDRIRSELDRFLDSEARKQFVTALAIDHAFAGLVTQPDRDWQAKQEHVTAPSVAFFGTAQPQRVPPEIGRTSALAAARPFFSTFWHIPDLRGIDAFGAIPRPVPKESVNGFGRLETAASTGDLVVGLVSWRAHAQASLSLGHGPGWFTVQGVRPAAPPGTMARLVDRLFEAKVDVAVLPELMLDPDDERELLATLAGRLRRYPSLVVAGRTHRANGDGGSFRNEGIVVDGAGSIVFAFEKLEPFFDVQHGQLEHILPRQSREYPFLDTPVGRLVVNICRDVGSDPAMILNRAIEATFLVVPTYTRQLDFIVAEARALGARQRAITITANPTSAVVGELDDEAYAYVPARGRRIQSNGQRALEVFTGEAWRLQDPPPARGNIATIHTFRVSLVGGTPTLAALASLVV